MTRSPTAAGLGAPTFTTDRSACSVTGVSTVAVLLSGLGSGVGEETWATLVRMPVVRGSTTPRRRTVTRSPTARSPMDWDPVQGCHDRPPSREYSGRNSPRLSLGSARGPEMISAMEISFLSDGFFPRFGWEGGQSM